MKKANSTLFILFFVLSSCATTMKSPESRAIAFNQIETLALGSSVSDATDILGQPTEQAKNSVGGVDFSHLDPLSHAQTATLGFDSTGHLFTKVFLFKSGAAESALSYLLNEKYHGHSFEKVLRPACGHDFIKPAVYVDKLSGLFIYPWDANQVDYVFWVLPIHSDETRKSIEVCKL